MAGCESSKRSKVTELNKSVSSKNCLIYAPCVAALQAQTVSDSVELRSTSGDCPDFAQTLAWPGRRKKNHPPVERIVSPSSAWDESTPP